MRNRSSNQPARTCPPQPYAARSIEILANIEACALICNAQQGDEMSARAPAPYTDLIGVNVILTCISAQKTDSTLHILDHGRELILRREAIVHRADDKTHIQQCGKINQARAFALIPFTPSAAMNINDGGRGTV